jgi:hypothetical protein
MDGLRTQKSAAFIIARSSFQTAMAYKDWEAVFLSESFMVILIIIIGHTPFRLRHAVLLLFLSYGKPSNGENHTLYYYYA